MQRPVRSLWILAAVAAIVLAAPPAFPQATTGEITGRVLDAAGAAVPGATVDRAQRGHRPHARQATTNADGRLHAHPAAARRLHGLRGADRASRRRSRRAVPVNVGTRVTLGFDLAVGDMTRGGGGHGGRAADRDHEVRHQRRGDARRRSQNLPAAEPHLRRPLHHHAGGAAGRELRPHQDAHRQLRDERRRRAAARRQRGRRRQQGQRRGQPDPELRLRVDPGVPGPPAPLDGGERPLGGRRRERHLQVGHQRAARLALRQLPRRRHPRHGLLREAAPGGRPDLREGRRSRARSSAARWAGPSSRTSSSSSARWRSSTSARTTC